MGVMIKNMSFEAETHTAATELCLRTYINTNTKTEDHVTENIHIDWLD